VPNISQRGFSSLGSPPESWLHRVRENFWQLFARAALGASSANGAPIHLLRFERSKRKGSAQAVSLFMHGAIIAAIVFAASRVVPIPPKVKPEVSVSIGPLLYSPDTERITGKPSSGPHSGGGDKSPTPATRGFFASGSPVPLAPPRLPDNINHLLPVTATILDAQAPPATASQNNLGLPWMPHDTNSGGPGSNGIGAGRDGGMGDREGPGGGEGDSDSPYARGISLPTCLVCPYPVYTDEARHVKMQGTVTLRVLVSADGKASEIRVLRGVGFGLEERAAQTVRGWKFNPARDASHNAVPAWVIVEAVFRLY
jgi:protein TonB